MSELTKTERDALLTEYAAIRDELRSDDDLMPDERRALGKKSDAVLDEYVSRLPQVPIGRCPFNGEPSFKRMDTFGLDGKWWYVGAPDLPVIACSHFITFLGAFNRHDQAPDGCSPRAIHEIMPGPEVPFVVPRLLEMPGMAVVISSRKIMDEKYTIYFMAYYNEKPVTGVQSHQQWLRTSHSFLGPKGQPQWASATDPWDFDLQPWRFQPRKVFWIAPNDQTLTLRPGNDPEFPYENLPGLRQPQVFRQGKVFTMPVPNGLTTVASD